MKMYVKPTLSLIIMGVFWIMACATIKPPKEKTIHCDFIMPAVSQTQKITIEAYDQVSKLPIFNAQSSWISMKYDKVQEDTICRMKLSKTLRGFNITDGNGKIIIEASNLYYSIADNLIFDIDIRKDGYFSRNGGTTLYYNEGSKTIKLYLLKSNDQP